MHLKPTGIFVVVVAVFVVIVVAVVVFVVIGVVVNVYVVVAVVFIDVNPPNQLQLQLG